MSSVGATPDQEVPEAPNPHLRHLAVAERGKIAALDGDHAKALEWYRTALRMARIRNAPPPFARHYTDCILESLEHSEQYGPALELCRAAVTEMEEVSDPTPLQRYDHGSMLLRIAVLLLRQARGEEADRALANALERAGEDALPLARELRSWRSRAWTITPDRLTEAQRRHGLHVVRREALRPDLARYAPESPGPPEPPSGRHLRSRPT